MPRAMRPVLAFPNRVQLEQLPLILAIIVGLAGCALVIDAFLADQSSAPATERRRRVRADRHRLGEALVGFGLLAVAAGLAGRDSWSYSTLTMMGGAVLLVLGAGLNYRLLGESLFHHGAARRQTDIERGSGADPAAAAVFHGAQGSKATEARSSDADRDPSLEVAGGGEGARVGDDSLDSDEPDDANARIAADRPPPLRIR